MRLPWLSLHVHGVPGSFVFIGFQEKQVLSIFMKHVYCTISLFCVSLLAGVLMIVLHWLIPAGRSDLYLGAVE